MQPVRFRCDVFHKATTFATARHKFSTICQLCKWTLEQFVHIIYTLHKILEFPFKYVDIELFNCHIVSNTICNQVQLFFYWCTHCWKHKLHVYLKQKHIYEIKNRIPEVKLELFLLKVFLISYKKTKGLKTTMAVVNLLFKYRKEVSEKKKWMNRNSRSRLSIVSLRYFVPMFRFNAILFNSILLTMSIISVGLLWSRFNPKSTYCTVSCFRLIILTLHNYWNVFKKRHFLKVNL